MLSSAGLTPVSAFVVLLWATLSCTAEREGFAGRPGILEADGLGINTTLLNVANKSIMVPGEMAPGDILQTEDYRIGPLKIEKKLGNGQFGIVYEAKDRDGISYAVKLMLRGDQKAVYDQWREIDIQKGLFYNNYVVKLETALQAPWPPNQWRLGMMVLEKSPFGTLESNLWAFRDNMRCALKYLKDTFGGLQNRGNFFVHADIKADNTLLFEDPFGQICFKLADFGLAYWGNYESGAYGDPKWVPQELKASPAGDVFCAAETAMTMYTGDPPMGGWNPNWNVYADVPFWDLLDVNMRLRMSAKAALEHWLSLLPADAYDCPAWLLKTSGKWGPTVYAGWDVLSKWAKAWQ